MPAFFLLPLRCVGPEFCHRRRSKHERVGFWFRLAPPHRRPHSGDPKHGQCPGGVYGQSTVAVLHRAFIEFRRDQIVAVGDVYGGQHP